MNFLKIPVLTLLLASVTICGCARGFSTLVSVPAAQQPSGQLLNAVHRGKPVAEKGVSWRSSVTVDVSGGGFCSGTLIGNSYVMTAAHCVASFTPNNVRFYNGHNSVVAERTVTQTYVHPHYDQFMNNDVAIVRFSGGLPAHHRPVGVLESGDSIALGADIIVVGAGLVAQSQTNGMTYAYLKVTQANSETIAATDPVSQQSACLGDSGGSGYIEVKGRLVLAGVTKSIDADPSCMEAADHTTFSLVSRHVAWIRTVVGPSLHVVSDKGN